MTKLRKYKYGNFIFRVFTLPSKFKLNHLILNCLEKLFIFLPLRIFRGTIAKDGFLNDDDDDVPDPKKIKWNFPRKCPMFGANYECKICKDKFARQSSLFKHLAKHGE